ncbi:hypothetical protein [Oceanicoccus sp. KOV_DT_Chl]|uniref:hypothetical protein n=1 Tax=Oceanicoccus sp. KOV_DT_Chl TaxID=1904639 RepID=UPI000C7DED14|nr:hypothetical protein [Oceanicoccus sp. KOV_DT_Chl]
MIRAQDRIDLELVATASRSSGSVSIIADRLGVFGLRPVDQAIRGPADVAAGQINIQSAFGSVGTFDRPIIVDSAAAPQILNLKPFINGLGSTPTSQVTGGVLGSSALDVASSSGLSSAVQTLIDTLDEIDPGVFKNDELVEREESSIALPETQRKR